MKTRDTRGVATAVPDEASLLERTRSLDPHALSTIYDLYALRIYSYIYHRVGDANLAEDLTAQVFLRMLEAIRKDRAWTISFSGWLYRIAHNLVIDYYRRSTHSRHVELDEKADTPVEGRGLEDAAELRLSHEGVRAAISRLTEDQAQVIALRFLEEKSIAEVAHIIGKSEGAVKALQYRAVAALRRLMDDER